MQSQHHQRIGMMLLLLLPTCALLCGHYAIAQGERVTAKREKSEELRVTLKFTNAPIEEVISALVKQAKVNVDYRGQPNKRISINVRAERLSRALEMLSKAAGCGVCRIRDKYLMLPLPTGAELIQQIGDAWKALRKFRAQLSISEWNGAQWLKSEHQLQFIAPDRLRIDVTTDDGQSQVWLMHGHETLQLLPALRIAERWYENRSTDWLSMFGGPANVAGFGQAWEAVVKRYRPKSVAVDVIRNTPVYILTLQCAKPRKRLVLEFADTGVVGLGFVYSPYLRDVEVEPATVRLAFDVNTKALVWRGHFRRDDRLINYATATTVKTISNEMPICKHYRIYDSAGTMLTECTYEFAKPGGASEDAWDIAPPPNTIIVDADLGGVRDYESKLKQKEDAHTHFNLARLYQLRLGDLNTALAHIESAMKILPRAPQLWWTAAQIYASAYRPEQAEEALQQLLKFSPDFPGAQSMLAETLAVQGKLNEAITTIERALANAKGASLSRLLLQEATYYEALGRLEEARKLHLRILDTHPIDVDAGITAADKLFTIAWANGDWDGLIREVSALRNANQNPYVQMLLMRIAFERGNIKLAMKHLRAVERVAVDNLPVRLRLAEILMNYGRLTDARSACNAIIVLHPLSPYASAARQMVAEIATRQQKYAEALGWLLAVERWVERPTAMRETVRAFRDIFMRHFCADLLQALVETALERNMHRETLYMLLTDLHTMGRNYNAAVVWARRGLARFPKNIWLKKVQLENLKRSARWRDAEHFLDRECRRNPHQPYFAAEKIWLYYRWRSKFELPRQRTEFALTLRRERNARNAFMKQFRQTPLASVVYGIALYDDFRSLQSLPQDACTVLETALKERLPDGDVHETIGTVRRALAMCYARMGKWSKARRQYQALLYSARNDVERMVILQGWLTGEIAKKRWRSAIAIAHAVLRGYEPISLKRTVMAIIAGAVMMPQNISAWQRSKVEEDVNARYNTFNQWFEQRKTDPLALLMAAEVARARGDERQASSYYETALVRAPDLGNHPARWDLIELIADALITLGKRERSQALYEQLIKTQPTRRSIYPKLLRLLMERGDNQKALKIARQMMIYAPWHASTLFQYAHVLAANRQVEAALKWLDRAIEVARSDTTVSLTQLGTYCLTKARLLEQMGKLEDAIPVYREVAQGAGIRRIVRRVAIQRLYQYYEVRGDTKEQIYWLRWLIWATPDENERRQLKQRLQELERALKQAKE